MKNKLWIILSLMLVVVIVGAVVIYPKLSENYSSFPTENSSESEKDVAPDFTVYDSEMNEVNLSDFFGKPIIINFWASWCGPCKFELPAFDKAHQAHKENVIFLMVNLANGYGEDVEGIGQFMNEHGYTFPVYYDIDHNAAYNYGISSIPETVFINTDGAIYDRRIGAMTEDELEEYIQKLT